MTAGRTAPTTRPIYCERGCMWCSSMYCIQ